jgi:hypothetical protein
VITSQNRNLTAKDVLKRFRVIIKEAAKAYDKAPENVSKIEFLMVANGRVGGQWLLKLGGYAKIRDYCYPNRSTNKDVFKYLERILNA